MNRWWAILGAVSLAGCVRFHPQPLSPAETAAALESRSLTNAALEVFLEQNLHQELTDWPAAPWDFELLTLAAFYYHPDLAVARAQWNLAKAGVQTAGGRPNPTLNLVPGYDTTRSALSPWFPAVSIDVPIETAGKRGHRIAAAQHHSDSARLNIATVVWQVRSRLRNSLITCIAAQQRESVLERQTAGQEAIGDLLEKQANAGALAPAELIAPRVALAKARGDLASAKSQLAEARVALAEAVGVPVAALDQITVRFDLEPSAAGEHLTSAEARRAALLSRTDILAALEEYAGLQSSLQLEIAKQYPDVHLSPGYQFDQGDNKWTLGITFDLPVLNQNQGPIAEAKARCEEAAAQFNALQAKVINEVDRATAVLEANRKSVPALRSAAEEQARQIEVSEAEVRAGAAEPLEVLRARLEFATTRLALLDAQVRLQQAFGALEDAVQLPLELPDAISKSAHVDPP